MNSTTIREIIDGGARTVDDIGRVSGAGTVCGKCRRNIAALLAEAGYRPTGRGRR